MESVEQSNSRNVIDITQEDDNNNNNNNENNTTKKRKLESNGTDSHIPTPLFALLFDNRMIPISPGQVAIFPFFPSDSKEDGGREFH